MTAPQKETLGDRVTRMETRLDGEIALWSSHFKRVEDKLGWLSGIIGAGAMLMVTVFISFAGWSLKEQWTSQKSQMQLLQAQIERQITPSAAVNPVVSGSTPLVAP